MLYAQVRNHKLITQVVHALVVVVALMGVANIFSSPMAAQEYLSAVGSPSFTTAQPVELGFVNVGNGNMHFEIPLTSVPQRGKLGFSAKLVYDSRVYRMATVGSSTLWQPNNVGGGQGGWRFVTSADVGSVSKRTNHLPCDTQDPNFYDRYTSWAWTAPDGTKRTFPISTLDDPLGCEGVSVPEDDALASDSSGYHMYVTNYTQATVFAPDGTQVFPQIKDSNGNYFTTATNSTDTLGRQPVLKSTSGNQTFYDVLTSQGTRARFTVTTQTINVNTSFGQSGVTEYSGTLTVVQSIALPDGTSYAFNYDSGTSPGNFGLITSATLPTGGQVTYGYTTFQDSYSNRNRWLNSRKHGSNEWKYDPVVNTSCPPATQNCQQTVTVRQPSMDETVFVFRMNNGAWATSAASYTGAAGGTPLQTVSTDYDFANACILEACVGAQYIRTEKETVTVTVPTAGGTTFISRKQELTYDSPSTGNVITKKEWDWATSLGATPTRQTDFTYVSGAYLTKNIRNLPTSITVKDSSGAPFAQTFFDYDTTSLTSLTGVTQHDDLNYGTGNTVRGNLTRIRKWVSGVGCTANTVTCLTSTNTYDTTGQLLTTQNPKGDTTSFSYSNSFYNDAIPPTAHSTSATNAYPTQITSPLIGTASLSYYFGTGQLAIATDHNGAQTENHYLDSFNRPTHTFGPTISGNRAWSLTNYTSATEIDNFATITDTTASSSCTSCIKARTTLDTFGRVNRASLLSDPQGAVLTDTAYDSSGRVTSKSNPYRTTSDPTYGLETPAYDGLNRITQLTNPDTTVSTMFYGAGVTSANGGIVSRLCPSTPPAYPMLVKDEAGKRKQTWQDAFGRIVEVDEQDDSNALTIQTCYTYDVAGNLKEIKHDNNQTRTYNYDGLGRVTSENTPERDTVTYAYTTSGGLLCSGDAASVCRRTDSRSPAVVITYSYDALNRLTGKTYSDGTPSIAFEYDQVSIWGLTLLNGKGRLTHQVSDKSERVFSYDAAGRLKNQWECLDTSNCGTGTYNTVLNYDLGGNLTELTYPSGRKVTYGYNNARRLNRTTFASFNGTPVNKDYLEGATYAPPGGPTSLAYGNGLTETFAYNNRVQMNAMQLASAVLTPINRTFTYSDGTRPNAGKILAVNDLLKTARTQNYTYDPMYRLKTAEEAGASGRWGVSYVYDEVGNLLQQNQTKGTVTTLSVTVNSKNQIVGNSYDGVGNLTAAGTSSYVWDGENRLKSINSGAATYHYDANSMRVVKQVGSATTEYILLGAQVLAERRGSDWSDYIYAGGKLIARADNYHDVVEITGSNCSGCGSQFSIYDFPSGGGHAGYVIRSGDKLAFRQWQAAGDRGGMRIRFTDGSNTNWTTLDQDGKELNNDDAAGTWHYRRADLSAHAGKTISHISLISESTTDAGAWQLRFTDIALLSADGDVRPVYNRQKTVSLSMSGSSGVTGRAYQVTHLTNTSHDVSTNYFHGDQLGSSRLVLSANGYPTWQATYLPFGEEYSPQIGMNTYKFTGYDRDSESGLDYAKFRYHSSQFARFISPDPLAGDIKQPQSLNRYAYVRNNPCGAIDPLGLCDIVAGGIQQGPEDAGAGIAEQVAFANEIGAHLVFPYAGGGLMGGLLDVAQQGLGIGGGEVPPMTDALLNAAAHNAQVNVFTFSGSEQTFVTAYRALPDWAKAKIGNVTFVSPGGISNLEFGSGKKTVISNRAGITTDNVIGPAPGVDGINWVSTSCGHEANCTFREQRKLLRSLSGEPCSNQDVFARGHLTKYDQRAWMLYRIHILKSTGWRWGMDRNIYWIGPPLIIREK